MGILRLAHLKKKPIMLSQLHKLSVEADGRYATDPELSFLQSYLQTVRIRLSAYQKIQAAEGEIVQQVLHKINAIDPSLLQQGAVDLTPKWQRDTARVLRYAALALLIDDPDQFKEKMLLWFQTIMRAFGAQRSCNATYLLMQDVMQQYLTPAEAQIFLPILELSRRTLADPT